MVTSGTFTFQLEVEEMTREAFERCGVDITTLTNNDWESAMRSLNLLFVEWSVRGVNYWTAEEISQTVTLGTSSYTLGSNVLDILNATLRRTGVDTVMTRMSLDTYDALPDKTIQGKPTSFFLDRQSTPIVRLWAVPENSTDTFKYWAVKQVEDINALAQGADIPYRWTEAVCAGLAAKLARKKAPALVTDLNIEAEVKFGYASGDERERATLRIKPISVVI